MTKISIALAGALVAAAVAAATYGPSPLVTTAEAASCGSVSVRGEGRATRIRTSNLSCRSARRKLRRWMRNSFPRNEFGWFCDMSGRRKLCAVGNGGGAPHFTFRLRR